MEPVPVLDEPALVMGKDLIIADLHIGIERDLSQRGVTIQSQTATMVTRLVQVCRAHDIDSIWILGDLKHKLPLSSWQEEREIPGLLDRLGKEVSEVHLVLGNHDAGIMEIPDLDIQIHPSKGVSHGELGLYHGHTWPLPAVVASKCLIMAHNHAGVAMVDTLGHREVRPCWVRTRLDPEKAGEKYPDSDPHVILMPAFNPLCWGTALNQDREKLLGPMLKNGLVDMENAEVYLLDGTLLGKLSKLHQ